MPLPSSGTITAGMIMAEFGGGTPFYISNYYRGGPRVPNIPANNNVPTSGIISFWNFYGASGTAPLTLILNGTIFQRSLAVNESVTAGPDSKVSGGVGPYTYNTVWVSQTNAVGITLSQQTTANPRVSSPGRANGQFRSGLLTTTVTDSTGATSSRTWEFQFQWGTPL